MKAPSDSQLEYLGKVFDALKIEKRLPEALKCPLPKTMDEASEMIKRFALEIQPLVETEMKLTDYVRFGLIKEEVMESLTSEFACKEVMRPLTNDYFSRAKGMCSLAQLNKINTMEQKLGKTTTLEFYASALMTMAQASDIIKDLMAEQTAITESKWFSRKSDLNTQLDTSRSIENDVLKGSIQEQELDQDKRLFCVLSGVLGNPISLIGIPDWDTIDTHKENQQMINNITLIYGDTYIAKLLNDFEDDCNTIAIAPSKNTKKITKNIDATINISTKKPVALLPKTSEIDEIFAQFK
jgi:hypothetical protein